MSEWENFKTEQLSEIELQRVRLTVERMDDGWVVIGPMVAAIKSWKSWLIAVGIVVWLNRPDIMAALSVLIGGQ